MDKHLFKHVMGSILLISLASFNFACVTTRAQLNEQNESQAGTTSSTPAVTPANGDTSNRHDSPAAPVAMPSGSTDADSDEDIDFLKSQLAQLNGRIDELEQKANKNAEAAKQVTELQQKITDLEGQLKTNEAQPAPELEPNKDYLKMGKKYYASKDYEEASQAFQKFIQIGKGEALELEEATYLNGECYFKTKEYKKAIVEYSKFTDRYQKSMYHPKALLRIAESFEALNLNDDMKAFYIELVEKFPKTAEGKLAKKRLESKPKSNTQKNKKK